VPAKICSVALSGLGQIKRLHRAYEIAKDRSIRGVRQVRHAPQAQCACPKIWDVSKNLKWERPYAAPASCRAGAAIDGGFENVLAFCCYCIT
jgi:hypothetical protein